MTYWNDIIGEIVIEKIAIDYEFSPVKIS